MHQTKSKIVKPADFIEKRKEFRQEGKKIVHCHGVFDLLHPGHIAHLEEAKGLGDILVVSVTSAPFVNKGPGRPYFSDEHRMNSLAALSCVDYVLLSEWATAEGILEYIQPDIYVKGKEYEKSDNDVTQNIDREIKKVQSFGGEVYYTDGVVFSSTKLINNHFPVFSPKVKEFALDFASRYSFEQIRKIVEEFKNLKVLVVGDIIIDEYVFCKVQGLMTKDRAFSARYEKEERYLGGALAIARHLVDFAQNNVTVCGIVGDERNVQSQILNDLSSSMFLDLQFEPSYQTIIKRRFVERRGIRDEYEKLFSINYLHNTMQETNELRETFHSKLEKMVADFDMVMVADYGHGLLDQRAMDIIQDKARFLALNCQTNSTNFGTNPITKYRRADAFTLDEAELRLAFADRDGDATGLLERLMQHLNSRMGWLTQGSLGSQSADKSRVVKTPALTLNVQDTVGAGDAFFALVSLCACLGVEIEIGSFLGNIAGAMAANILGNKKPIKKGNLLKFASTMLNF